MNAAHPAPPVTWLPSPRERQAARLTHFAEEATARTGKRFANYAELHAWSVSDVAGFWDLVREHFDVIGDYFESPSLRDDRMPGAVWYPESRLNYAENVLRYATTRPTDTAIVDVDEDDALTTITWSELARRVGALQGQLRSVGVDAGDRVAAVLPNIPEAIIGLLAVTGLGATWTISSPDLSVAASLDRLRPLAPKVLIGVDGYRFNAKQLSTLSALTLLRDSISSVDATLVIDREGESIPEGMTRYDDTAAATPTFLRVPFDHPLWVLFSSGTTGTPKGIVHGHGGMALEALKAQGLNQDLGSGDRYFAAANTSWMVWNSLSNSLITGCSVVTYSGSPVLHRLDRQFVIAALTNTTMLATGASYLALLERADLRPADDLDLSALRSIMSTGSVLAPSTWNWVHARVKKHVHLGSDSGGTDICSGFIGSNPWEPVYLGELQGPLLGVAVEAQDEAGARVTGQVGEMVVTRPLPSMPVAFWNDRDQALYRAAYFANRPKVWTQGDWISETPRGGFIVHGRSDATLNRDGVRLGSADIYAALQEIPGIRDGVVLGLELPDANYRLVLFVALTDGTILDDELRDRIRTGIRARASARHVPDEIVLAPDIPITHAGKRIEVPLKKLFLGYPEERSVSRGALANPAAIDWFALEAARFRDTYRIASRELAPSIEEI